MLRTHLVSGLLGLLDSCLLSVIYAALFNIGELLRQLRHDDVLSHLDQQHDGKTIYEWEQSLDEINIYITPPPGVKAAHIDCNIQPSHLTVGLKGNPPFINVSLFISSLRGVCA